ncbi:hypothetical protein VTL71DRAFT_4421 [Oculimacula yallundae]|uniref:Uncharacterized protein n=1 Tax=Oculimacula yallundae TaxID=86028 RepID=A0ABR4C2L1_9HELO
MSTSKRSHRRILSTASRLNRGVVVAGAVDASSNSGSVSKPASGLESMSMPMHSQDVPAPLQMRKGKAKTKMEMEMVAGEGPLGGNSRSEDAMSVLLNSKPPEDKDGDEVFAGKRRTSTPSKVKRSLRATCEDVLEDTEDGGSNVYRSPPAPIPAPLNIPAKKTKGKAESNDKPGSGTQAQYRDMPTAEIDLNPKSPKSPKTDQQSTSTNPNHTTSSALQPEDVWPKKNKSKKIPKSLKTDQQSTSLHHATSSEVQPEDVLPKKKSKKKKKRKSSAAKGGEKFIPPAVIRSPTQEEKQERWVKTFALYDNQFQIAYEKISEEVAAGGTGGESLGVSAEAFGEMVEKARIRNGAPLVGHASESADVDEYIRREFAVSDQQMPRKRSSKAEPITEFLQKSNVKVDGKDAAVGRAQDFWAEPNQILGQAGKDLNHTFKTALDRAAGAKIGSPGPVGALQAGTILGLAGKEGAEAVEAAKRSVVKGKECEGGVKLCDELASLTVREENRQPSTVQVSYKEGNGMESDNLDSTPLRRRIAQIKAKALTISYTPLELQFHLSIMFPKPAFNATWFSTSIISQINTHPKFLDVIPLHNTDLVTCTEHFMSKLYPMFNMHDDSEASKIHIWVLWLNGCEVLWRLIHDSLRARNYTRKIGLYKIDQAVIAFMMVALPKHDDLKGWQDMVAVLSIFTLWFVEEYHWAGGDFDEVIKSAEVVFPDQGSLMRAINHAIGTQHLAFPAREPIIKNAIAESAWSKEIEVFEEDNYERKLAGYGSELSEVMQFLDYIIDGLREVFSITSATSPERAAEVWAALKCFEKCGFALWNLVQDYYEVLSNYENGLGVMVQHLGFAMENEIPTSEAWRVEVFRTLTLWFVKQWKNTDGDLAAINQVVLKELPNLNEDLEGFMISEGGLTGWPELLAQPMVRRNMPSHKGDVVRCRLRKPISRYPSIKQALADMGKSSTTAAISTEPATPTNLLNSTPRGVLDIKDTKGTKVTSIDVFGHNIAQVVTSLERIIDDIRATDPGTKPRKAIELKFMSCAYALWEQVKKVIQPGPTSPSAPLRDRPHTGLDMMCFTALNTLDDTGLSGDKRLKLLLRLSMWFLLKWRGLGGDLEKVNKEALLELPTGNEDLELFAAEQWKDVGIDWGVGDWMDASTSTDTSTFKSTSTSNVADKHNADIAEAINKAVERLEKVVKGTAAAVSKPMLEVQTVKKQKKQKKVEEDAAVPDASLTTPSVKKQQKVEKGTAIPEAKLEVPTVKKQGKTKEDTVILDAKLEIPTVKKQNKVKEDTADPEAQVEILTVKKQEMLKEDTVVPEAKLEISTIKQGKVTEADKLDKIHENMEYIVPSFIPGAPGPYRDAPAAVSSWKVNSTTISSSSQEKISAHNQMGSNILQVFAEKANPPSIDINENENANPQQENEYQQNLDIEIDNEDNMPQSTIPPTPPMTSEELNAQPGIERDLITIHNSLATLEHNLYKVDTALYGQSTTPFIARFNADVDSDDSTEAAHHLNTDSRTAGLLVVSDYLVAQLKDAQTQIAGVDSKIGTLSTAIAELHRENQELKTGIKALNEKMGRSEEEKERMPRELLEEVKGLKAEIEIMGSRYEAGEKEKVVWVEKARELKGVVDRAREVGGLSEVLWPQGDGFEGIECAKGEVKADGIAGASENGGNGGKKGKGRRELYVKVGNQAGRGQGGGGFCAIM